VANKQKILAQMIDQLQADLLMLEQAVELARDTATHSDCLGSSKYETMGLEASYLAQGQGIRLLEVERSLSCFKKIKLSDQVTTAVSLSSLLQLEDDRGSQQMIWLAAVAGGLKVECDDMKVTVVTPQSPLGRALVGKRVGDELEIKIAGVNRSYEILTVY